MFFDLTVAKSPCQLLSSPSPAFNLQVLCLWGFPGGSVVKKKKKKPPTNAGDMRSIPG